MGGGARRRPGDGAQSSSHRHSLPSRIGCGRQARRLLGLRRTRHQSEIASARSRTYRPRRPATPGAVKASITCSAYVTTPTSQTVVRADESCQKTHGRGTLETNGDPMQDGAALRSVAERLTLIAGDCFDLRAAERLRTLARELQGQGAQPAPILNPAGGAGTAAEGA